MNVVSGNNSTTNRKHKENISYVESALKICTALGVTSITPADSTVMNRTLVCLALQWSPSAPVASITAINAAITAVAAH